MTLRTTRARTLAGIAVATLSAAATGLGAQTLKPTRDLPLSVPVLVKPMTPQEEVMLTNMPHDMIILGDWAHWWPGDWASGTLPGRSNVAPPNEQCRPAHDYIDLARIRANGFRVVRYELLPMIGPRGYAPVNSQFVTQLKTVHGRYLNAHDPAEIDRLDITPPVYALDVKKRGKTERQGCASTWRLSIHVKGPKGIDPYTGARK